MPFPVLFLATNQEALCGRARSVDNGVCLNSEMAHDGRGKRGGRTGKREGTFLVDVAASGLMLCWGGCETWCVLYLF